ncbi:MAG TPA: serine/threonine-protein kinase [Planctomycetota bacterium]|jgi:serine/threonine-protein kinase
MPNLDDIRLGQLAVAQGLCQPAEVEECLALQHHSEQTGKNERMGELLIGRGYLTRTQLSRLLNVQREADQKVSRIGQYELIRKLGEGGMGAVYQARDTRDSHVVALKVLPRSRAKDKTFLQRFEQEARAAFELDHPNIVHGLDVGQADGYNFLVMEYVQGYDVFALLEQKGRLTEQETLNIVEQIASALDHIHGEHLVHRDIKPENIIVTEQGVAKLTDMGLALDSEMQGRRRITQAGIAMGTPFYLSPEQIEGKSEADIRSDIYSLGTTVYEMVTGRPPFEGETPAVVMMKHLNEQVPSPHEIDHTISLNFCHLIERMMAKNISERYQTPAELVADVQRVKKGLAPQGARPAPGRSSVSRPDVPFYKQSKAPGSPLPEVRTENVDALEPMLAHVPSPHDSRFGSAPKTRKPLHPPPPATETPAPAKKRASADAGSNVKLAIFVGLFVALAALALLISVVVARQ